MIPKRMNGLLVGDSNQTDRFQAAWNSMRKHWSGAWCMVDCLLVPEFTGLWELCWPISRLSRGTLFRCSPMTIAPKFRPLRLAGYFEAKSLVVRGWFNSTSFLGPRCRSWGRSYAHCPGTWRQAVQPRLTARPHRCETAADLLVRRMKIQEYGAVIRPRQLTSHAITVDDSRRGRQKSSCLTFSALSLVQPHTRQP